MPRSLEKRADEVFEKFRSLAEQRKIRSEDVLYYYSEVGKCYAKDPNNPRLQEFNRKANVIWNQLPSESAKEIEEEGQLRDRQPESESEDGDE